MYIMTGGSEYRCTRRESDAYEVRYYGISPTPDSLGSEIALYTDEGFWLRTDTVSDYARQSVDGARVTLSNRPEPVIPEAVATPTTFTLDASMAAAVKMLLSGSTPQTDDEKITVSALWDVWSAGNHAVGEIYTVDGEPWEVFQAYDNAVNPDITPDNSAWFTFNRPLHGTSANTARSFVQPTGAHDIYHEGEWAVFEGKFYECTQDTAYSPAAYGTAWAVQE